MPKPGLVAGRRPEAGRRPPQPGRPPPAGAWSPSAKSDEGVKVEKNTKLRLFYGGSVVQVDKTTKSDPSTGDQFGKV